MRSSATCSTAHLLLVFVIGVLAVAAFSGGAKATIQDDDLCWEPDIEFPVPCDEDDD